MKCKIVLLLFMQITSFALFAQGERKLNKNFSFVITEKLDTVASFSIDAKVKRSGWGEFTGALTQALIAKGFSVTSKENLNSKHSISIVIDYSRGFFAGKMQYADLRGQMIGLNKNVEVFGTFGYKGRFNPDDIANAIAAELKSKNPIVIKEEEKIKPVIEDKKDESPNFNQPKSKQEKLAELKSLYEKELITKEEYDRARQKIIEQ